MATERIPGFCALCRSRCGCVSVVEDGRLVAVEPDPAHPTGRHLCVKGRAAPELVYAPDRLLYPMKRTRPRLMAYGPPVTDSFRGAASYVAGPSAWRSRRPLLQRADQVIE
jgi:anaerobic selenocysteine-containing dehydrogenase